MDNGGTNTHVRAGQSQTAARQAAGPPPTQISRSIRRLGSLSCKKDVAFVSGTLSWARSSHHIRRLRCVRFLALTTTRNGFEKYMGQSISKRITALQAPKTHDRAVGKFASVGRRRRARESGVDTGRASSSPAPTWHYGPPPPCRAVVHPRTRHRVPPLPRRGATGPTSPNILLSPVPHSHCAVAATQPAPAPGSPSYDELASHTINTPPMPKPFRPRQEATQQAAENISGSPNHPQAAGHTTGSASAQLLAS